MSNRKNILHFLADQDIKTEWVSDNILAVGEVTKRYLVFEGQEIYTKFDAFIALSKELAQLDRNAVFFRIPFFAGCSVQDLSYYVDERLEGELNIPIDYFIYPIDFNLPGLDCYYQYLVEVASSGARLRGCNNWSDYKKIWIDEIMADNSTDLHFLIPKYILEKEKDLPVSEQVITLVARSLKDEKGI